MSKSSTSMLYNNSTTLSRKNKNNDRIQRCVIFKRTSAINYSLFFIALSLSLYNILVFTPSINLHTPKVSISPNSIIKKNKTKPEPNLVIHLGLPTLEDLVLTPKNPDCPEGLVEFHHVKLPLSLKESLPIQKIPRIIHFTLKSRCVTPEVHENLQRWAIPNHEVYLHDDTAVKHLLRYATSDITGVGVPFLKEALPCVTSDTALIDIWRLIVLWYYGGIYLDIDNAPGPQLDNFSFIKQNSKAFFIYDEKESSFLQYFIASCPNHPILRHSLYEAAIGLICKDNVIDNSKISEETGSDAIKRGFIDFQEAVGTKTNRNQITTGTFMGGMGNFPKFGREHIEVLRTNGDYQSSLFLHSMGLTSEDGINNVLNGTRNNEISQSLQDKQWSVKVIDQSQSKLYIEQNGVNDENMKKFFEKVSMFYFVDTSRNFNKNQVSCTEHIQQSKVDSELPSLEELVATSKQSDCPNGLKSFDDVKLPPLSLPKQKIPRIIHFTAKSRCVSQKVYSNLQKWIMPNYQIYFHDDTAVHRLLRYAASDITGLGAPFLKQVLSCVTTGATLADIWRLVVLWYYGGIYSDIDNAPGPLMENFSFIKPQDHAIFTRDEIDTPSQFFLASRPHHPILRHSLYAAIVGLLRSSNVMYNDPASQTGPGAVKRGFIEFQRAVNITSDGYLKRGGWFKGGMGRLRNFGPEHVDVVYANAEKKASLFLETMGIPLIYDINSMFNNTNLNEDPSQKWAITVLGHAGKVKSKLHIIRESVHRVTKREYYKRAGMVHFLDVKDMHYSRRNPVSCVDHIRSQHLKYKGILYEQANYVVKDGAYIDNTGL